MSQVLLLKTLEEALEELKAIPLWGSPPSFPWEAFSEEMGNILEQKDLKISHHKTEWLGKSQLLSGMGQNPHISSFSLSPLPGSFYWVMSKENNKDLSTLLLTTDHSTKGLSDPTLQEGFMQFITLNVLETFNSMNPYGNLVAILNDEPPFFEEGGLCIDVSIQLGPKSFWGRLICPRQTHALFKSYFSMEKPPLLSDKSLSSMPLTLEIQIGSTTLPFQDWKKAKIGDFVFLDRCTFDLLHKRGTGLLSIANSPLFDVKIKEGEVKILEYALIQEEPIMTRKSHPEEDSHLSKMDENSPLWSPEEEGQTKEHLLPSEKIPISLMVEVGRFQMPLEKVMQLKPGNVLDLGLTPEPIVHLTANGKRIAKGELVKLGEALGVKILQIGE